MHVNRKKRAGKKERTELVGGTRDQCYRLSQGLSEEGIHTVQGKSTEVLSTWKREQKSSGSEKELFPGKGRQEADEGDGLQKGKKSGKA